jgi:hypothetical protein
MRPGIDPFPANCRSPAEIGIVWCFKYSKVCGSHEMAQQNDANTIMASSAGLSHGLVHPAAGFLLDLLEMTASMS